MKARIIFLSVFLLLLSVCLLSCANETTNPGNDTVSESETEPSTVGPESDPNEATSVTVWPMGTEKIPVSRQTVIDYMLDMASVKWKPTETATYTQTENWNINLTYEEGTEYTGVLYSFTIGNLSAFRDSLNEDGYFTGTMVWSKAIGVDCTTAVMAAWQTISPSTHFQDTAEMFSNSGKGVIPAGDYNWDVFLTDSTEVTKVTTKDEMCRCYINLKPGDLVMSRWATAGHCRMVDSDPNPVYVGNEKLVTSRSTLSVTEQCSSWNSGSQTPTTWKVHQQYSFDTLYDKAYIPVTCIELQTGMADAPYFTIDDRSPASYIAYKGRLNGKLISNYRLMKVTLTVTDEDGNILSSESKYPTDRECSLSAFNSKANLFDLPNGTYTITIEAEIGPGTFTVDTQTFVKNE